MINIVENTLRDGSYVVDFQLSKEDTKSITQGLDSVGFEMIEVGHGLGLGAWDNPKAGLSKEDDATYIKAAKEASKNSKIGVFFIPGIGTKEDISLAKEHGIDFIRIGTNVDNYKVCKEYVQYAKSLGLFTAVNLMKSYGVKPYEFTKIVQEIDNWQLADVVYLVDSAGCMMPDEVFEYIDRTRDKILTPIGFHGHNNLSMAAANTIEAIKGGASYIDTCIRGMGRSAGNAQTEIVVFMLQKLGIINTKDFDIYRLYDLAEKVVEPLMPRPQGLSADEIHIGVSKFHSSYLPIATKVSNDQNVDKRKLIKTASEINCINPTEELFNLVANEIKKL